MDTLNVFLILFKGVCYEENPIGYGSEPQHYADHGL